MSAAVSYLVGAMAVIGMFILLIGPHEAGHFGFAKLFRVKVIEFSLGMGTRLLSGTRGGTLYALRLLPIGGYVRLGGMEPGDYDAENGFHTKSALQRVIVLLAGPGVNFLLAALIATALGFTQLNSDPGKVVLVVKDSPAFAAGIRPGDHIDAVNGHTLKNPADIRNAVAAHPEQPLAVSIKHAGGGTDQAQIQPQFNNDYKRYVIGVETEGLFTPTDAIYEGVTFPYHTAVNLVAGIAALASGQIPGGLLGPNGATGAIGIGYLTVQAARSGFLDWLYVLAILSVALGLANLLPLPALDGGRIVVVLLERVRGRPFDREREMQVQRFGLVALLALVLFIAFFDVQRLVNHQFPGLH